jgi:aryl-alcohol dehydrogenase-like predicted oxidoreductase
MDYFKIKDKNYKLSRFTIGTVQLGKTYGIDTLGKPSDKEAQSILKYGLDNGINVFDTAPDYGDSEEIIGKFLSSCPKHDICVATKLDCHYYDKDIWENKEIISSKIREDFNLSCRKLGLDKIPAYLVHHAPSAFKNNAVVLDALNKIKCEGKIGSIGVSLYTGDELKRCTEDKRVETVQIPFNILDRRLAVSGLLGRAKKRGLIVFARSTYLQGLLLMEPERIPEHLSEAVSPIKELRRIAKESSRSIKELCLKYVLSLSEIDSIVVGINSIEQIEENIKIFDSKPLDKEVIEAINKIPIPPEDILNPGNWDKLEKDLAIS